MTSDSSADLGTLREISRRVLWLATAIVDAANRGRPDDSGLKVGGHQASSASMVDIAVALWFHELTSLDRVSVKPHASPVPHAVNYLLGDLEETYLPRLREKGGPQSYPSRSKDPDTVDFSTGSVGIGATATIWAALAHRYARSRFATTPPAGRFIGAPKGHRRSRNCSPHSRRTAWPRRCATSAATTSDSWSTPSARSTRNGPRWSSPTPSRAGARPPRATRATIRRC